MMFVDFVARPPLPPPPPVTLSFTPDSAPLSAPPTGESPLAAASPPLTTALRIGPPSAMPSRWSPRPLTRSVTVSMARSPRDFSRSCETSLSLSRGSTFAIGHHLPDRERLPAFFAVFFAVRLDAAFFAVVFLAAAFLAGPVLFLAADFVAAVFLVAVFFAVFLAG